MKSSMSFLSRVSFKPVLVLGAGVCGIAAARLLANLKADVTLLDDFKSAEQITESFEPFGGLPKQINIPAANPFLTSMHGYQCLVLSPGIAQTHPLVQQALATCVPVIDEIDLAAFFLPHCTFVGITGTNGKSTTTTLLGHIAQAAEPSAFVGGNLGKPLCQTLLDGHIPKLAILELSSYQLETLSALPLQIAIVTNLAPDHLDRYGESEAYYLAKTRIFSLLKPSGTSIINGQDALSERYLSSLSRRNIYDFHVKKGQKGVFINKNVLEISGQTKTFEIPLNNAWLIGDHNLQNAAAAVAAAVSLNIPAKTIQAGIHNYRGIAHRLQLLGIINQVAWVNDSKATNIHAACIGIQSFPSGIHLILGGIGKGSSYEPLIKACQNRVKAIYTIGQEAAAIYEVLSPFHLVYMSHTLEKAVQLASHSAKPGDVILLCPACASLDQFDNFAHRGESFKALFHAHRQLSCELLAG